MYSMLFGNNSGSGANALLDGASFYLELTHTAVPARGSIVPSFTRATVETGQKWDEAGYLDFTALAGEVVFKGARRVYNQWTTSSVSLANLANKSLTLAAGTHQFSMGAGTGTATFSGTGGATGTLVASASGRVSVAKTITAGTFVVTASVADLADLQVCDITGETDQTTIRPYVSVGVESAPAYHGSMVDGVKCYDTDRSGNPISTSGSYPIVGYVPWEARTNMCLQSNAFATAPWTSNGAPSIVQNATGPDGATSAWTVTDSNAGLAEYLIQGVTLTAATHSFSLRVGKTVGATTYPLVFVGASPLGAVMTLDTNNGVATVWTQYDGGWTIVTSSASCVSVNDDFWRFTLTFLATAASWNLVFWPAATSNPTQSTGTFTPSLTGSAVFYDAQVELGAFATPYIPTTTVAVARNADVLSYTGGDIPNLKTLCATFRREVGVSSPSTVVALSDGTTNEYAQSFLSNATQSGMSGADGGAVQWSQLTSNAYTPGTASTMAWSAATNDVKMAKDGVAQTADTSATMPTVTQLSVGHITDLYQLNGPVNHIYGWTRNLSQSELGAIDR